MTDCLDQNYPTDSTNGVQESTKTSEVTEVSVPLEEKETVQEYNNDESQPSVVKERPKYEVVFFVRYYPSHRPSMEEIVNYFGHYGNVHHVNCPNGKNYAFVFMTSLYTHVEHRRTRTVIGKIISEMPKEREYRFHITVANSFKRFPKKQPGKRWWGQNKFHMGRYHERYPNFENTGDLHNHETRRWRDFSSYRKDQNNYQNPRQVWVRRQKGTYNPKYFSFQEDRYGYERMSY